MFVPAGIFPRIWQSGISGDAAGKCFFDNERILNCEEGLRISCKRKFAGK